MPVASEAVRKLQIEPYNPSGVASAFGVKT
jgi:hypothetical protein